MKAKLLKDIRTAGLFSNRMTALTGYLKARGHMSYSTLQSFFADIMDLNICQSYLTKICTKKLLPALQPAYAEVGRFIRTAPVVGTDETRPQESCLSIGMDMVPANAGSGILSYQQLPGIQSTF